ncbi:4Fe-4S binding domain protein [Mycoplasma sp. CAG:956]|nr:4Fe-4S binding domain protein [Mycoplasma sp. CAG:956]
MKKVGIVSCYFKNNYGSMLQAYATKKILDNNNIPNETINIDNNIDFKKGKRKYYASQLFNFKFIKSKFGMIKLKLDKKIVKDLGKNISIRDSKYKEFRKAFNLSISCPDYKSLSEMADAKYSDVIVGSDQLWLPVNVVSDYYTLNWVSDNINKISYATSFGISKIPDKYTDEYKKFLSRINYLSVREESGKKICDEYGISSKVVCDPTILLTKEEWEQEAVQERIIPDKYILCYFLGSNIEHRKFAEKLKEKTGYKIVSLNHADEYVKYSDTFADITPYDIGPREWINLIKNAEYVCTDSFHGTVFSLLFNKTFFDFRRYSESNKMSTNSRIDSLLDLAGVDKNRILTGNEDVDTVIKYKINYNKVNKNIDKIRQESKKWLLSSITYKAEETKDKFVKIEEKDLCCGCTACYSICPKNAIKMVRDNEGFLYPEVDREKCVNCGMCKKVCPILNKAKLNEFKPKAYLFQNSNEEIRKDSTSGGIFTAIGEFVIKNNGIVYGATFDDNFAVNHIGVESVDKLSKFRKSKYVQSNQNNCFKEIKQYLDNGKLVCYSGTPCQVGGLRAYLRKDYENLILVDIMCHSVPSPLVFEKYKRYILKKMNANKILNINFRDKSKYGYKYSMMMVETDNGTYSQGIDTDPYLRAFFSDVSVRTSCYNCHFKTMKRVSDLTIWDCFNINEIDKSFDDDKGTTRVLVQSEKGEKLLENLDNVRLKELDINIATKKVKEMTNSVNYNSKRKEFFENINDDNVFEKYYPTNFKTKINSFVRKTLAVTGVYSSVKSFAKKILRK